ncbi:ankyrin repeat and SOCS box protein 3-like [Corticium candelabrum]|uniref:ankyrin repeat and SOCS box protein 3-like n=1 Tax=Corticium candelabrum TaxID=121492 RepID=UPI002E2685BE|nr:ankyrin repeat and SOCS box protein 3-like [Corticium candelabrum]
MSDVLATVCADGNYNAVEILLNEDADPNQANTHGFKPLCLAAFWGHEKICKLLLEKGADINGVNMTTLWTALHCAAFQGHGKVVLTLLEYKPNLALSDHQGRTAADFASALDAVWSFFAAQGCQKTTKAELIKKGIIRKVPELEECTASSTVKQSASKPTGRPGSAYVINSQNLRGISSKFQGRVQGNNLVTHGDVLSHNEISSLPSSQPSMLLWKS